MTRTVFASYSAAAVLAVALGVAAVIVAQTQLFRIACVVQASVLVVSVGLLGRTAYRSALTPGRHGPKTPKTRGSGCSREALHENSVFDVTAENALVIGCLRARMRQTVTMFAKHGAPVWVSGNQRATRRYLYNTLAYVAHVAEGPVRVYVSGSGIRIVYDDVTTSQMGEREQTLLRASIGILNPSLLASARIIAAMEPATSAAMPQDLPPAYVVVDAELDAAVADACLINTEMTEEECRKTGTMSLVTHGAGHGGIHLHTLTIKLHATRVPVVAVVDDVDLARRLRLADGGQTKFIATTFLEVGRPQWLAQACVSHILVPLSRAKRDSPKDVGLNDHQEDPLDLCFRLRQMGFNGVVIAVRATKESASSDMDADNHLAKLGFDAVIRLPPNGSAGAPLLRTGLSVLKHISRTCVVAVHT
jgi:hypothetical protein